MILLEAQPLMNDTQGWVTIITMITGFLTVLFKEYIPIWGKKIEAKQLREDLAAEKVNSQKLLDDIKVLTNELAEVNNQLRLVEGWFFAMQEQLNKMGASNIIELINKMRDESNT